MVAALLLLVMQACTTVETPGGGETPTIRSYADGNNTAPAVVRFEADSESGIVTSYEWRVDGRLVGEIDGTYDAYFARAGTYTVTVSVEDGRGNEATASTDVEIRPAESPYTIDVRFFDDEDMTLEQRRAFSSAARRWAEVIRSDFPSVGYTKPAGECQVPNSFNGTIDDILIYASIADIDGPGKTVGLAGPCDLDSDGLPTYGVMQFDVADLDYIEENSDLEGVILHEMGHVLGIGTVWNEQNLLDPPVSDLEGEKGSCFGDPRFVGANAVREWHGYGGTGEVPVEPGPADGTSCGHWREWTTESGNTPDLYNELMTGYLDASMALSRITIGSLEDIGYSVNYAAADPWTLFPSSALRTGERGRVPLNDLLVVPASNPDPVER